MVKYDNYSLLIPLLLLLYHEGLNEFREKWATSKYPQKLSKWISMFVSPSGEHVAIAVGNEITILQRDDNYQEPCGIFTCKIPKCLSLYLIVYFNTIIIYMIVDLFSFIKESLTTHD